MYFNLALPFVLLGFIEWVFNSAEGIRITQPVPIRFLDEVLGYAPIKEKNHNSIAYRGIKILYNVTIPSLKVICVARWRRRINVSCSSATLSLSAKGGRS